MFVVVNKDTTIHSTILAVILIRKCMYIQTILKIKEFIYMVYTRLLFYGGYNIISPFYQKMGHLNL